MTDLTPLEGYPSVWTCASGRCDRGSCANAEDADSLNRHCLNRCFKCNRLIHLFCAPGCTSKRPVQEQVQCYGKCVRQTKRSRKDSFPVWPHLVAERSSPHEAPSKGATADEGAVFELRPKPPTSMTVRVNKPRLKEPECIRLVPPCTPCDADWLRAYVFSSVEYKDGRLSLTASERPALHPLSSELPPVAMRSFSHRHPTLTLEAQLIATQGYPCYVAQPSPLCRLEEDASGNVYIRAADASCVGKAADFELRVPESYFVQGQHLAKHLAEPPDAESTPPKDLAAIVLPVWKEHCEGFFSRPAAIIEYLANFDAPPDGHGLVHAALGDHPYPFLMDARVGNDRDVAILLFLSLVCIGYAVRIVITPTGTFNEIGLARNVWVRVRVGKPDGNRRVSLV